MQNAFKRGAPAALAFWVGNNIIDAVPTDSEHWLLHPIMFARPVEVGQPLGKQDRLEGYAFSPGNEIRRNSWRIGIMCLTS